MGLIGTPVSVSVCTPGGAPVMIAHMTGKLLAGSELSEGEHEGAVFFQVADPGSGFILARESYAGAGWSIAAPATLILRLGPVALWVEREGRRPWLPAPRCAPVNRALGGRPGAVRPGAERSKCLEHLTQTL